MAKTNFGFPFNNNLGDMWIYKLRGVEKLIIREKVLQIKEVDSKRINITKTDQDKEVYKFEIEYVLYMVE